MPTPDLLLNKHEMKQVLILTSVSTLCFGSAAKKSTTTCDHVEW